MGYLYKRIALLLLLIQTISISAQNIEQLRRQYANSGNQLEKYQNSIKISEAYLENKQLDSALIFADEAIKITSTLENLTFKAEANQLIGKIHYQQNNWNNADSFYSIATKFTSDKEDLLDIYTDLASIGIRSGEIKSSLPYIKKVRDLIGDDTISIRMINYYTIYSAYYGEQHEMWNKLQYLLKAKSLAKQFPDFNPRILNYNLSIVYLSIFAYDQALSIFIENRENAQNKNNPTGELFALYGVSHSYYELKQYAQAKKICHEAIALKERSNISLSFGYIYYVLGNSHLKENQLDSAEYYFNLGIKISEAQNEKKELGENYIGMSQLMYLKGDKALAKFYAKKARENISYIDHDINDLLTKIYADDNDFKNAYSILRENWDNKIKEEDNLFNYKIISTLLNEKFKQEKEQEQLIFEQKLSNQRRLIWGSILLGFLGILTIFAAIQVRNNRKLKHLNYQLNQRNKTLQHFTFITSHDLKEPIRNIKSFSGLLQKRLKARDNTSQEEQEYLDFISNSSDTLNEIVESLKIFTESRFGEIKREPVVLNEVFHFVESQLQDIINIKNAQVNFHIPDDIKTIDFSKNMLILVLQNLIQNGLSYNDSDQPSVDVSLSKINQQWQFKVADNGKGIQTEFQNKIFEPFKTLTNKSITKSSGLGLAICKNIIENYGGKLWVESDGENGSQFYFTV